MQLNADFSLRAMVLPSQDDWVASPAPGVERLMLDRVGDEVARATSIVRYAAGCSFDRHTHGLGEEFLVLEGVFSDESGDYGPGMYVRNPPGSGHAPFSEGGCRILVKLRQFDEQDLSRIVIDTADDERWPAQDGHLLLHRFGSEIVLMCRVRAGTNLRLGPDSGGVEAFVVSGMLCVDDVELIPESWLRLPPGDRETLQATSDSVVYLKCGHLAALL